MAPAHLRDLFARFWRGSDKPDGGGLGLSIVEEIALQHAGQTFAAPVTPHGLRVGLKVPLSAVAPRT
ncbi:two-component sensor protein [compost metagenome]